MKNVTLNYKQSICIIYDIYKLKSKEEIIEDKIINEYIAKFLAKSIVLFMSKPIIFHEMLKKIKIFEISKETIDYIANIIQKNPLEIKQYNEYYQQIISTDFETELFNKSLIDIRKNFKRVEHTQNKELKDYVRKLKKEKNQNISK